MAVNSKRGDKSSLKHPISRAAMEQARQTLKNDPTISLERPGGSVDTGEAGIQYSKQFSKVFGQSVKLTQQGRNLNEPEQQLEQNIIL